MHKRLLMIPMILIVTIILAMGIKFVQPAVPVNCTISANIQSTIITTFVPTSGYPLGTTIWVIGVFDDQSNPSSSQFIMINATSLAGMQSILDQKLTDLQQNYCIT